METLEVADVSLHVKVTDYVPPKLACNGCGAAFGKPHKYPCFARTNPPLAGIALGRTHAGNTLSTKAGDIYVLPKGARPGAVVLGGQKHDSNKPPMDLLDKMALEETARVLAFGAKKYAAHNWRQGLPVSRTLAAALRHIFEFLDGETNDRETGLNHLAHAMCEVMFALNASKTRPDLDDRYGAPK